MESLSERLTQLGRGIADVDRPDDEAIAHARRRWIRQPTPRRHVRWWLVVVPSAVVVAVLAIAIGSRSTGREDNPLTYVVDDLPGVHGQWIDTASKPALVQFSDGTRVDVAPGTKVRVSAIDARGGAIEMTMGKLVAAVVHDDTGAWRFQTGPYTIRVKGTRFETSWDASDERFTLDMHEGAVEVIGPLLPAPIVVTTGQSVVSSVREDRFEIRRKRTADAASPAVETVEPIGDVDRGATRSETAPTEPERARVDAPRTNKPTVAVQKSSRIASAKTDTTPPPLPADAASDRPSTDPVLPVERDRSPMPTVASTGSGATGAPVQGARRPAEQWRDLLAARAYASAIAAAEKHGFDAVLLDATSVELYALADAARYAGRPVRAREALIALRSRFGERGKTAFLLGRIAADRADADDAIQWFDLYLREEPSGTLAEAATGRLIELYRPRDAARARKLAERYLAAYPDGTYAALARTMLSP